ncbi:poly [ADP-ribose] polymerase 14-like [Stylophora pistillata]|nr:poly [ADP-ribose] polymerase 14-like [Stylophora pistillata]XP_022804137.1 poly [ADP-ribose] polymerase 14-like [Stylophora pistillata]
MGTLTPVDEPSRSTRGTSGEVEGDSQPKFYKLVDKDIMEFLLKSNQEPRLKERLHSSEHAGLRWKNGEMYVLIKYECSGKKTDNEFDEKAWKSRCSEIVDSFIDSCTAKEIPVDEEIWEAVTDQLPQIEGFLPKFTAHVKLLKDSRTVKLICQKSNMSDFEEKLGGRLMVIRQQEDEKKLERRTLTDIASEKLLLFQNARIEDILKKEVHQDIQVRINPSNKNLEIKTPKGSMASVVPYLRRRQDEIDQNAIAVPPEIIEILKTKVGRRKMNEELPDGCAFNVDDRSKKVIFLGRTPHETQQGKIKAKEVLVSNHDVEFRITDNDLISSKNWDDLCKKLVKRLTIRHKRELACIAVFGFKKDVMEAVKRMRDFLNEKKATEGETRLTSQIHRKFFKNYYQEELKKISDELHHFGVQIAVDERGERIKYSGNEEGVKEAEERIYILLENIREKSLTVSLPGMKTFLTQEEGRRLTETIEMEKKCIIRIMDEAEEHEGDDDDSESEEPSSDETGIEENFEGVETFSTAEGKNVTWKIGNIADEQADILVCSVGSKFNLAIGAIANAISKAAGPDLQEQLRKKTFGKQFDEGDIVHTGPGNLHCRHVIHCVCCPWKGDPKQEQLLQELFRKCFDKASELGACSISMPLVGTGNLGFPCDTAVQILIQAAVDYSRSNPDSPLEEFKFVLYGEDERGIETFTEKFRDFKGNQKPRLKIRKPKARQNKPTPALPEFKSKEVCVEDVVLKVMKGDITEQRTDAICNIVTKDLNMKFGNLSGAIIKASGSTVEKELKTKAPKHPAGSVVITSAGRLSAECIAHMVVGPVTKKNLQTCVEKALEKVDSMGLKSVSIPAVGSGGLGQTADESAELVFGAIRALMVRPDRSIREIRVVVFDNSVTAAFVAELEAIQGETDDFPHPDDEDDDQGYYEMGSGASIDVLTRKRRKKIVIHARSESFDAILTALKDGVEKACGNPRVIRHEIIGRLPKRCMRELKRKSRARDVRLEQPEPNMLTLEGLPKDVMDVNSEVSDVIQEQMEREHKEERAEQMSKTVQWYLVNPGGKLAAFEKMANNEIESAYKEKKPSLLFTHQDRKAEINFGSKEVTFLRTGAIKMVLRKDVLPLPDEWDPQPRDDRGKEEILHMVSLPNDSQEYKAVGEKFLRLMNGKVVIKKIERIQNPSMFNSYMLRKQAMDEKNGTIDNELELFHGTKPDSVKEINVQGFNRSLCGVHGAAYGDGVYFAKDARYSFSYSQPGPNDERCMYLARVLVGKYTVGEKGLKKPPAKDPSKPEILFDSVVNREEDPTIFVVFNDFHVYPKYLINFEETKR